MEKRPNIRHFRDLMVYQRAFDAAMKIFEITKGFPADEKYSLVDQIRRLTLYDLRVVRWGCGKRR